jgi:adenylate cyclase
MSPDANEPSNNAGPIPVRRAILVLDLVESVRLMQADEAATIARWRAFVQQVRAEILPRHEGQMVKSLGDGMLLAFGSTRQAVGAALEAHGRLAAGGDGWALRGGLHLCEVVADDLDVYGAGVNLAARLAGSAQPGETICSAEAAELLAPGLDAELDDLGDIYLKHIDSPVRAYRALAPGSVHAAGAGLGAAADLRPRLAVVPFACRDPADPAQVLGDVIADELSTMLSGCREWQVISKLSAAAFAGRDLPPPAIGSILQADFVCSGAYHRQGDAVTLHVQLVRAPSGELLWAGRLQGSLAGILAGEDGVFEALGGHVADAIFGHGLRLVGGTPLPQLRSHELLLGAVALMHRARRGEFDRALQIIEFLQERHPRAAQPNAWRAKWHVLRVVQGWSASPAQDGDLALQAGRRALACDGGSSLALAMQGLVHAYLRHDFDAAAGCYDEALERNPSESMALLLRGTMFAFMARGDLAYQQTQQALRLSPLDPLRHFYLSLAASAAISAGRYTEAIELAQRSLRANSVHLSTHRALVMAQSLAGQRAEAAASVARLLRLDPEFSVSRFQERFPGRQHAPEFTRRLADALAQAGLPP